MDSVKHYGYVINVRCKLQKCVTDSDNMLEFLSSRPHKIISLFKCHAHGVRRKQAISFPSTPWVRNHGWFTISDWFILGDSENEENNTEEQKPNELKICAQCDKKIEGKFLLRALDQFWHEECLKCSYCNTQLADLSFKFYLKGDLILCKRDYIRWATFIVVIT